MKSTGQLIDQLEGLLGTKDISQWEESFITNMVTLRKRGRETSLSDVQLDHVETLWKKHFA